VSKPDWKEAPEWADYLAMDACGDWWWYEYEPGRADGIWFAGVGQAEAVESQQPHWSRTLEQRP